MKPTHVRISRQRPEHLSEAERTRRKTTRRMQKRQVLGVALRPFWKRGNGGNVRDVALDARELKSERYQGERELMALEPELR